MAPRVPSTRAAHNDHPRPRTAAGRRTGCQRLPGLLRRPHGVARAIETRREVRAMWAGEATRKAPSTLLPRRAPAGSAFKAFDLPRRSSRAYPGLRVGLQAEEFIVPNTHGQERFVVHNDKQIHGLNTLINATAYSDNSIYAEVGLKVARKTLPRGPPDGNHDPLSTNRR